MINEKFISTLPETFVRNTMDLCGDSGGKKWLNDLPQIIKEISEKWHLTVEKPFENLSYNYVAPCKFSDRKEAVLKIAPPLDNPEIFNEAKYLQIQNGKGTVKVLNFDENFRAMLLEKLNPGKHLKKIFSANESQTVEIAIGLIKKLHRKPPADTEFILLEKWFENFFERAKNTEFPNRLFKKTRKRFFTNFNILHKNFSYTAICITKIFYRQSANRFW